MSDDSLEEELKIAEERAAQAARLDAVGLRRPLRELPTLHAAVTCEPRATVRQAIQIMQRDRIGCVLIVEQNRLVGIFTERDILAKVAAHEVDIDRTSVGDLMTRNPECLRTDTELVYALNQMSVGGYRHIPLLDDQGRPVSVVSMRDIVTYLVELFSQDVLNLPPTPTHEISQAPEGA